MWADFPRNKHLKQAIYRGPGGAGDATVDATNNSALAAASANEAETSATSAASSATAAANSATAADTSADSAANSATSAAGSATTASTAATNAGTYAANSSDSADAAAASASDAADSATAAASSASAASTSASNASTSASNAASSASSASTSASTATAAKDAALAALDSFDDRYLGVKASDPTVDNDGDPLVPGALYYNTTDDIMKVYEGSLWVAAYASSSGALLATNNLSDLTSTQTALNNLAGGVTSAQYLRGNGANVVLSAIQASDVPTLNQNTTGSAATLTTGRTLGMTGDVTWTSASFNGSANVTGTATISTVTAAKGGTGQTSYAVGDILYASTTTALSKLADAVTGNALISGGVGVAPSYGKIGLTTHVSGTLPVANGGTGVTTATGSGNNVLSTSPTLVTPMLGTPTSGNLANCTFPTLNQNTTGSAATLTTGRTIAITGDLTYTSASFNGSADVTGTGTLATVNSNVGAYGSSTSIPVVTVNAKGLVTSVSTATVAGGQYFGAASTKAIAYNSQTIAENVTVTAGNSGLSAGPITISSGYAVTVASGSRWVIL